MNLTLLVLAIVLAWFVITRRREAEKEGQRNAREVHKVDQRISINPGHRRSRKLSAGQIDKIKSIHQSFLEVYPISLEETIINFQKDINVDQEIDLWMTMSDSYLAVLVEKKYSDINLKKEVFQLLLMSSMLPQENLPKKIEIKILTKSDLEYVLNDFISRRK
jgi:hypothetical protein